MADVYRVGPCWAFLGNPLTASGADMTFIGKTRGDVTVAPNVSISLGRVDQQGVTPLPDAVFFSGLAPIVTLPLVDEDKAKMAEYLTGATLESNGGFDAVGFGSGFKKIALADIKTLALLPVKESYPAEPAEDPDAIWLPAVIANQFGTLTFNLPDGGDDSLNPHETQFAGLLRQEDQGANAIPASMQVLFFGSPSAGSLAWTLPDPTTL